MGAISNTILLVEDNEDDAYAVKRALKKAGVTNPLHIATDGRKAVEYLTASSEIAARSQFPIPFLVLLDLKLPYRDGFDVLEWIRNQPHLAAVVVVMLTGSDEPRDQQRAYSLGARSYLVKPASPDELKRVLESLEATYWSKAGAASPLDRRGAAALG
jgi:CheY-like chemotaxis protein